MRIGIQVPDRTSTANARLQWALPDLNKQAPDRSGHCRTSTASARSQCAVPDPNSKRQIAVGTAGPQQQAHLSPSCNIMVKSLWHALLTQHYDRIDCSDLYSSLKSELYRNPRQIFALVFTALCVLGARSVLYNTSGQYKWDSVSSSQL